MIGLKKFFKRTLFNIIKSRKEVFPKVLSVEFTSACNAKCIMCPQPDMDRKKENMSPEILDKIIKDCKDKPYYDEVNLISLRNTTLANYMNGCSISLPYSKDDKPIGIMLNGTTKNDEKLLGISAKVETVLSK